MIDREKNKRNRTIKVLIVDFIMAASVVAVVTFLVGMVSGWRFGAGMNLQQNGLVQINSEPSGAAIIIDGKRELFGTNSSKMLTAGKHTIVLEKDGYDSWSKEINITPGWLLNLQYPRLFKQDRERSTVAWFDVCSETLKEHCTKDGLKFLYNTPDRRSMIYGLDDGTTWYYVTALGDDKPKTTKIDFSAIFPIAEGAEKTEKHFDISSIEWNRSGDRVLVKTSSNEWIIVNLKNPKESVNISNTIPKFETYKALMKNVADKNIVSAKMLNDSANEIYVMISNSIFKVNLNDKVVTATPASGVSDFALFGSEVIFTALPDESGLRAINIYKDGDKNTINVYTEDKISDQPIHIGLSGFYGQKYVIFTIGNELNIYRSENFAANNISEMELITKEELFVIPESIEISSNLGYFVFRNHNNVAVYDAEIESYSEYSYFTQLSHWLDNSIMYGVEDKSLKIWDYDGINQRTLVTENVSDKYDVFVNSNDKYLYYVVESENGFALQREKL